MIKLPGHKVSGLPFGNLTLITEIISFENSPMLIHYQNDKKSDILTYWVDFGNSAIRWIYIQVTKNELYLYLTGRANLRDIFSNTKSQYIFLVDKDLNGEDISISMITPFEIPDKYIAGENSFFTEGLSEYYEDHLPKQ